MKLIAKMMVLVLIGALASCGEKEKPLYDQVMDIHDEVMPKMGDLYKIKKTLQDSLVSTPDMPEANKRTIEASILQLDSATNSMMVWMREFNPPDKEKDEKAFTCYMETELVKVKLMREEVLKALESQKK